MKALERKLLRDLWRIKGQVATLSVLIAAGIASLVGSLTTYRSLALSRDRFYARSHFADVFGTVQRAPLFVLERLRALDGVSRVEGRVVEDVRIELPGSTRAVQGRFTSLEPDRTTGLNRVEVRRGRLPARGSREEVVVGEAFARANGLEPGAHLDAIFSGQRVRLRVVGIGFSPEYVWVIPPGHFTSDDLGFGVFWMDRAALSTWLGMDGAFNDVVARLSPGASPEAARAAADAVLEPYGSYGTYGRDKQPSHRLFLQEMAQLRLTATFLPAIIFGVAIFLLNVLLARTVATQREQIAALKALGYSNRRLGGHYASLALLMVAPGVAGGLPLAAWAGRGMVDMYRPYFRLPDLSYAFDPSLAVIGALLSAAAALVGALGSARRAARLPPAEAMRPEFPRYRGATVFERSRLLRLLPVAGRMVLRDLLRHPVRTLLSALGVAIATAILITGNAGFDAIDALLEVQWERSQREDLAVSFAHPLAERAVRCLGRMEGVDRAEGVREVPVRLRAGPVSRETILVGVDERSTLRRLVDARGAAVTLPESGIALSRPLAQRLNASPGDWVEAEVLEGDRPRIWLRVGAPVDDVLGMSAYARIPVLDALLKQGPRRSGAVLTVDRQARSRVERALSEMPRISTVQNRAHLRTLFREQIAAVFLTFQIVLTLFASAICVGVVYNNARIALAVRARDLATLRILGFTRGEVGGILVSEQAVQLLLGVLVGLPLGRFLAIALYGTSDPELFRLPVVISAHTQSMAASLVLLSGVASIAWVRRQSGRLDLLSVLKARD